MSCMKGGLIIQRHGDIAAEWHHLCAEALKPSAVTDEPLIHTSRDVCQAGANSTEPADESQGDVATHGFWWLSGTMTIFDVRITDTDCVTHCKVDPMKVLRHNEKKKDKYNQLCLACGHHFTPLVFSMDGLAWTQGDSRNEVAGLSAHQGVESSALRTGRIRSVSPLGDIGPLNEPMPPSRPRRPLCLTPNNTMGNGHWAQSTIQVDNSPSARPTTALTLTDITCFTRLHKSKQSYTEHTVTLKMVCHMWPVQCQLNPTQKYTIIVVP